MEGTMKLVANTFLAAFAFGVLINIAQCKTIFDKLNVNEVIEIQAQFDRNIAPCLAPPLSMKGRYPPVASLILTLKRDGTLAGTPVVLNAINREISIAALHATVRCLTTERPLRLNPARYDAWKTRQVDFFRVPAQ